MEILRVWIDGMKISLIRDAFDIFLGKFLPKFIKIYLSEIQQKIKTKTRAEKFWFLMDFFAEVFETICENFNYILKLDFGVEYLCVIGFRQFCCFYNLFYILKFDPPLLLSL